MNQLARTIAACSVGAVLALAAVGASAQSDGSDYHPLQLNSPDNPTVDKQAVQAAHSAGTEAIGQSTSAPAMQSRLTRAEVRQAAIEANHAMSNEPTGQSTAMAAVKGADSR
jgi:hypothetical protein